MLSGIFAVSVTMWWLHCRPQNVRLTSLRETRVCVSEVMTSVGQHGFVYTLQTTQTRQLRQHMYTMCVKAGPLLLLRQR